ncbi:CCHC-type domain-containing protein [Raphanus sativus]|nr:CCHC-type domain-containing protein [Raphanus sativus]
MENPWLTVTLFSPLNPSIPVGNLSHSPPIPDPPDPPDPLQFPPLPSPLSGGQKPPKKLRFYRSSPNPTVPSPPIPSLLTTSVAAVPVSSSGAATSAPSTADLLVSFISLSPSTVPKLRSRLVTVNVSPPIKTPPDSQLCSSYPSHWIGYPPSSVKPCLITPYPLPNCPSSPTTVLPPKPSYASKTKATIDRSLRRLSPKSLSLEGIPRVIIPDEVYQKGAELHKDFLVCRFFGRIPAYSLIQNVLNYLWGKGKHLEIHMLPQSNSVLVRLPNEFIREKVLQKRYWSNR